MRRFPGFEFFGFRFAGGWYEVSGTRQNARRRGVHLLLRCRLRGSLKRKQRSEEGRRLYADPVAVGDEVIFAQIDDEEGVIEDILPRRTKLSRRYPVTRRDQRIEQIVVANADQIVIVISTRLPDFNLRFLDRFLILAEAGGLKATICLNKMDLVEGVEKQELIAILEIYQKLGYQVIYTSISAIGSCSQVSPPTCCIVCAWRSSAPR